jgi:hypothetical protein
MPQWGIRPPPDKDCEHSNGMFEDNIADGIDHPLGVYDSTDNTVIDDKATCDAGDVNGSKPPGTVITQTGVAQSTLAPGLITGNTGGNGFDGRLTDTPFAAVTDVFSVTVDNTPLWQFISNYGLSTDISSVPDSCQGHTFIGGTPKDWDEDLWVHATPTKKDPLLDDPVPLESADSFEHMARCLREYRFGEWNPDDGYPNYTGAGYDGNFGTGVLFDKASSAATPAIGIYDLQLSPRWGWSPVGDHLTGTSPFKINQYVPIYINTLVAACNNTACNWVWHAGQTPSNGTPPPPKIASMISFQIPQAALPQAVHDYGPYSEFETQYTLTK